MDYNLNWFIASISMNFLKERFLSIKKMGQKSSFPYVSPTVTHVINIWHLTYLHLRYLVITDEAIIESSVISVVTQDWWSGLSGRVPV
jgi:hypothetical protein